MRAGCGGGSGRSDRQAGTAESRRDPRRPRALRPARCGLQRLRRVRDGEGRRRPRLAGRSTGCDRVADRNLASRRRLRRHLLGQGARRLALREKSDLARQAERLIPGGVNSPVRAMRAVGLDDPLFVRRGEGAYIETVDGSRYVDWVMSFGPLVFGHADPETVEAVREAAEGGQTYGASTEREVELAAEIVD